MTPVLKLFSALPWIGPKEVLPANTDWSIGLCYGEPTPYATKEIYYPGYARVPFRFSERIFFPDRAGHCDNIVRYWAIFHMGLLHDYGEILPHICLPGPGQGPNIQFEAGPL